jgi:hypothetical protein
MSLLNPGLIPFKFVRPALSVWKLAIGAAKTKARNRIEIARPMSCPTNVAAE